jgi:HEAT repeat protein
VLNSPAALAVLVVSVLAWFGLSLVVVLGRAHYELRARSQRHRGAPRRGSRDERRLLRRAASAPHTELGRWRRIGALRELARARHPACRTLLPAALADSDDDVVGAAVRALGELRTEWAAGLLLAELADGTHSRSRVATQLEHFAPSLLDELDALLDHPEAPVRYWAATLLARYDEAPIEHLLERSDDVDPNVRAAAVETLGLRRARSARARVVGALRDDAWVVRLHACRALGRIGSAGDSAKVVPLLGDGRWWVRAAAKEALRQLAPGSVPAVVQALEAEDPFARNGAAEVLQDVGVVDRLTAMGTDPALLERILRAGGERLRATAATRGAEGEHDSGAEAA